MKKNIIWSLMLALFAGMGMLTSCNDEETYEELKKRESRAIGSFLNKGTLQVEEDSKDTVLYVAPIKVISEEQFAAQDSTTDVSKNEYVLLNSSGVYMQIVNKGAGEKIKSGETVKVINRYVEFNILGDSVLSRNTNLQLIATPDIMTVNNSYGVFTGSFLTGIMRTFHSSTAVPDGWLIPLTYINICRSTRTEDIALVRIIVPHASGTSDAKSGVYPCFYELTYRK